MDQNALTVIVPIRAGEVEALRTVLREIGDDIKENARVRFRETPSTHFARWVILDGDPSRRARLLFSSSHDGTLERYAHELAVRVGRGMEGIWEKCEGYPPGTAQDPTRFEQFLRDHSRGAPQVFYAAYRGKGVGTVSGCLRVREALDGLLDREAVGAWLGLLSPWSTNSAPSDPPPPTAGGAGAAGKWHPPTGCASWYP